MRSLLAFALLAAAAAPAWGADPEPNPDAELMRMEAAKWRPASLAHPFELMSMFSDEMLSVEYAAALWISHA